jgi:twitching motility two-component system response regulator PilG
MRALVVDDSTTLQRLIELTLRSSFDVEIDFAESGEQALHHVVQQTYDLVFLDVTLPGMDGYKVCKAIKGDKKTRRTPVIMLTSRDSTFDKVRGTMAGVDVYLTKPLDRAHLLEAVRKCLPVPGMVTAMG